MRSRTSQRRKRETQPGAVSLCFPDTFLDKSLIASPDRARPVTGAASADFEIPGSEPLRRRALDARPQRCSRSRDLPSVIYRAEPGPARGNSCARASHSQTARRPPLESFPSAVSPISFPIRFFLPFPPPPPLFLPFLRVPMWSRGSRCYANSDLFSTTFPRLSGYC